MTAFDFGVLRVEPARRAVSPTLTFRMRVRSVGEPVDALALRVRVQLEPALRGYAAEEEPLLVEIFGARERWSSAVRPLQWHEGAVMLGRFSEEAEFDLHVPCTYDMYVSAGKYLTALNDGEIPVRLFFNGTVFRGASSGFEVEMLPWDLESTARFPLQTWREAMDACFPNHAWIRVERPTFDRLARYRAEHHLWDWDAAINTVIVSTSNP